MRPWRVGTLSMGLSLIFLGVVLVTAQLRGLAAYDTLMAWWPLLFVLLGLEIIVYLFVARKENGGVRYDFISVFFVGVLFFGCLGFTLLSGLGVIGEVRHLLSEVERTVELPEAKEAVAAEVKRIVVQTAGQQVKVDKTSGRTVHLFGSYRERVANDGGESVPQDKAYSIHTIGDTMYVQLQQPPVRRGFHSDYPDMSVTVVLPQEIQAEVRDRYHNPIEITGS